MFQKLNIPVDGSVPEGFSIILAYGKGDKIVVPINPHELESEDLHNCDWEGCGSMSHVFSCSVKQKYELDSKAAQQEINEAEKTPTNTTKVQICLATKEPCDRAKLKVVCASAYGTCQHQGKL